MRKKQTRTQIQLEPITWEKASGVNVVVHAPIVKPFEMHATKIQTKTNQQNNEGNQAKSIGPRKIKQEHE